MKLIAEEADEVGSRFKLISEGGRRMGGLGFKLVVEGRHEIWVRVEVNC